MAACIMRLYVGLSFCLSFQTATNEILLSLKFVAAVLIFSETQIRRFTEL